MNGSLGETILGNICTVIDCEHKTALTQDSGIPLIRTPNIGCGILKLENVKRVSAEVYALWTRRAKPRPGDLIMAREAPVGNVAIIPKGLKICLGQRTVLLRVKSNEINGKYLNYLLNSQSMNAFLVMLSNGATVGHLNVNDIRKLPLPAFPKKDVQEKIAAILSAYDDLIENNKRCIALLEKMAEEIYREWFVRMRFPGHEKVKFEKGVPTAWAITRAKEIIERRRFGRIYREEELYEEGKIVVIDQSRADHLGFYDGEPQHVATPESPLILFGDHSCKMVLMTKPFSLAENVIPFKPKKGLSTYFLYHLVRNLTKTTEYKRHWTELTNKEVLVPDKDLQFSFEKAVKPNHEKIEILRQSVRKSAKLRDLLLSRLISGKLSVENLDIQFPPSMIEPTSFDEHAKPKRVLLDVLKDIKINAPEDFSENLDAYLNGEKHF